MSKKWIYLLMMTGVLLAGCGKGHSDTYLFDAVQSSQEEQGEEKQVQTLILTHSATSSSTTQRAAQKFSSLVQEYLDGAYQVQIYPNDSLGSFTQTTPAMSSGAVDIRIGIVNSNTAMATLWAPTLTDLELTDADRILQSGKIRTRIESECEENGTHLAAIFSPHDRVMTTRVHLEEPEDFQRVWMRVISNSETEKNFWGSLGANTRYVPINQVLYALQQGSVNSQENTLAITTSFNLGSEQRYWVETRHKMYYDALLYSKTFYDSLEPEVQQVFDQIAQEVRDYAVEIEEQEEILSQRMLEHAGVAHLNLTDDLYRWIHDTARGPVEATLREQYGDEWMDEYLKTMKEELE